MYLQDVSHSDVSAISWLPIVSLVIFIAVYCIGWGPLPWTVMGEMFASNVKSKASGITVCVCWLVSFFITKFASNLQDVFGQFALFWIFAVFCVVSVLFTVLILPETKGKSLQEIQDVLGGNNHSEIPEFGSSSKKWKQYCGIGWLENDLEVRFHLRSRIGPIVSVERFLLFLFLYTTYIR